MAIDWSKVKVADVQKACEQLLKTGTSSSKASGLFIVVRGNRLPAKKVLRLAYAGANSIPVDSVPKFASGEASMKLLQRLGFTVERVEPKKSDPTGEN